MKISNDKLIKTVNDNLTKIFSNSILVNSLNNVSFCDLVVKQISILKFAEEKETKSTKSKEWLDKLNKLNNSTLTLSNVNYYSNQEALDEANYIKVYIQNVFKLDLDNLDKAPEQTAEQVNATPYNASNNANPNPNPNAQAFGGMGFNPYGPQGSMEQYIAFAANTRFTQEMMQNKFYIYKTKPKAIPIIKVIMGMMILLLTLMIVAKIVLSSIVGDFNIIGTDQKEWTFAFANYNLTSDILFILAGAWLSYTYFKKPINENEKFYIDWKRSSFLMILFIFFVIYYLISYVQLLGIQSNWVVSNDTTKTLIYATIYLTFAGVGLFFLYIIFYIIAVSCVNPKVDRERCAMRLQQIYEEIKNEMSKSGPTGQVF